MSVAVWEKPLILENRIQSASTITGLTCTCLSLAFLLYYFYMGSVHSPALLDDQVILKILNPNIEKHQLESNIDQYGQTDVLYAGVAPQFIPAQSGTPPTVTVQTAPGTETALIIPMNCVDIPKNIKRLKVSFLLSYIGTPSIYCSFLPREEFYQPTKSVGIQVNPNHQPQNTTVTMPTQILPDALTYTWDESDYLVLRFRSTEPTQLHLQKIVIFGYYA